MREKVKLTYFNGNERGMLAVALFVPFTIRICESFRCSDYILRKD